MILPTLQPGDSVEYTDENGYGPMAALITGRTAAVNRYHIVLFRPPPHAPVVSIEDVELVEVTEPGTIKVGIYKT